MKENIRRSRKPWTEAEDLKLRNYFDQNHQEVHWDTVASELGLRRSGNSAMLRWNNYLKPGVRRGNITDEEMLSILLLQYKLGNKWSKIARQLLPAGRRDNEIKNLWYTGVKRKANELNCKLGSEEFLRSMANILLQRIKSVDSTLFSPTAYDELIRLLPEIATAGGNAAIAGATAAVFDAANAQQQFLEAREVLRIDRGAVAAAGLNQVLEAAMQASSGVAGGGAAPAGDCSGFMDPEYGDLGHIWSPDDPNNNRLVEEEEDLGFLKKGVWVNQERLGFDCRQNNIVLRVNKGTTKRSSKLLGVSQTVLQ